MSLNIQNKKELLIAVQDLNALKRIQQEVEERMELVKEAIRSAKLKFHIPMGPANDLNGPNGGVTFAPDQRRIYKPDGIKKHLGQAAFNMFTEVRVKSDYHETIRKLAAQAAESGSLSEDSIREILEEDGEPSTKVIARLSKAHEIQIPFTVEHPEELTYQLQSPIVAELIENGFAVTEEVES